MDQSYDILNEAKKKEIYGLLADYYLRALEDGRLDTSIRKSISSQILNTVDKANSLQEVINFMDKLSQEYPFFLPAYLKLKGKLDIIKESEIISKLGRY